MFYSMSCAACPMSSGNQHCPYTSQDSLSTRPGPHTGGSAWNDKGQLVVMVTHIVYDVRLHNCNLIEQELPVYQLVVLCNLCLSTQTCMVSLKQESHVAIFSSSITSFFHNRCLWETSQQISSSRRLSFANSTSRTQIPSFLP